MVQVPKNENIFLPVNYFSIISLSLLEYTLLKISANFDAKWLNTVCQTSFVMDIFYKNALFHDKMDI